MQEISTKPYLLRALYEWCTDNGYTPHIAVRVDNSTCVPRQYVRDGGIVLNISFEATNALQMGNEWIEFTARFSGKAQTLKVPVANVLAIYARENGQGMAFHGAATVDETGESAIEDDTVADAPASSDEVTWDATAPSKSVKEPPSSSNDDGGSSGKRNRPHLKIVK
ncbi:MAG: ClpXP protease specificity-enhancing factor [Burkholderia sp.]|nr:MAG: hypothetical protein E5299_01138 [Burkholderia gladioli]